MEPGICDKNQLMKSILKHQNIIECLDIDIARLISEQNSKQILDHYSNLTDFGSFCCIKMWKLKKKILPNRNDHPSAKRDSSGNLATNKRSILNL